MFPSGRFESGPESEYYRPSACQGCISDPFSYLSTPRPSACPNPDIETPLVYSRAPSNLRCRADGVLVRWWHTTTDTCPTLCVIVGGSPSPSALPTVPPAAAQWPCSSTAEGLLWVVASAQVPDGFAGGGGSGVTLRELAQCLAHIWPVSAGAEGRCCAVSW